MAAKERQHVAQIPTPTRRHLFRSRERRDFRADCIEVLIHPGRAGIQRLSKRTAESLDLVENCLRGQGVGRLGFHLRPHYHG